jgi:ribosomal protein L21E
MTTFKQGQKVRVVQDPWCEEDPPKGSVGEVVEAGRALTEVRFRDGSEGGYFEDEIEAAA